MDSKLAYCEREEFRARLMSALKAAGMDTSPSAFTRQFNVRADGAAVTPHGARKWLLGESLPTQERLHVLARWLNVSPEWLRYGDTTGKPPAAANDQPLIPQDRIMLLNDFARLDERSQNVVRDLIESLLTHHSLRK